MNEVIDKYNRFHDTASDAENFLFMNDGFVFLDNLGYPVEYDLNVSEKFKKWRYQVLFYDFLLKCTDTISDGKSILDVGCGRGGGLLYYKENYNFDRLVGLDNNQKQIDFCREVCDGVDFVCEDATRLPFENNSFDIITNVESCDYYEPIEDFFANAFRVLKDNGLLIQATVGGPEHFEWLDNACQGKNKIMEIDITENVRIACGISKYVLLDVHRMIASVLLNDEQRYLRDDTKYKITVYKK